MLKILCKYISEAINTCLNYSNKCKNTQREVDSVSFSV